MSCAIFPKNIAQVFIKFTHSFVAIELLTFCKNAKKTILLLKRALSTPYVNRIEFFLLFVYIKTFRKKIGFCIWMKITMTAIIERQRARLLHKKQKQLRNVFIYKKQYTFQKARLFPLRFYIQKAIHLTLRDFDEIFELDIYIQKAWHFSLRDVFICKKLDTSQKAR